MKYAAQGDIMPYTDRKLLLQVDPPWNSDDLVAAQCMACDGKGIAEIALELGRSQEQVAKLLDQDSADTRRPQRSVVGYAQMKGR